MLGPDDRTIPQLDEITSLPDQGFLVVRDIDGIDKRIAGANVGGGTGGGLPPVTAADNEKLLAVGSGMWGTGPVLQGWAADPPVGLIPDSLIAASIARLSQLQDWALNGGIAIPESAIDAEIARVVGVAGWARVPAQSLVPESAIDLAIARVSQLEHPAHILHGAGVPTAVQGETDDYYLQTTDPPRWYQKTTGTTWVLQYTWPVSSGTTDGVIDGLALTLDVNSSIVTTATRTKGGPVSSSPLNLTVAAIPALPASKITSGIFPDARIPAEITRDTELATTTDNLGLAVDMGGNVYFRRDGSGSDSIHLSTSGGGYAYVDRTLNNVAFDSALGQIRFGGADNSDRAGWYLNVQPQAGATRGAIPQDVSNEHWIRIDNDIYPNIGGGQTTRLTSLLFRHPTPADALSTIYTIDPIATDAQAVDDQGATNINPYIYTPFQLASVVAAHQSPVSDIPRVAMIPTTFQGDLILLDHDYTEGTRDDAIIVFNSSGTFFGWSDGTVFGHSGTTDKGLSPLQFIRATFANGVYTVGQISSPNQVWITSLDKYVSLNVEYDLGPVTTLNGHYVRAVINGPASANLATPFSFNLTFTAGDYFLTDGISVMHHQGEYLWNPDATPAAYDRYDGWLGMTLEDHSGNVFAGIKGFRLDSSIAGFPVADDPERIGIAVNTTWLEQQVDGRVVEWARFGNNLRLPLGKMFPTTVVNGIFDPATRLLSLHKADGTTFMVPIPGGSSVAANPGGPGLAGLTSIAIDGVGYEITGGGGGVPTFGWAHVGNTDILPGPKLPSDIENVENSDITYIDATVSSFASRVAQLTTRTGVDSIQGNSYQFQWVDSDETADKRIAIQVNGGTIRTVVFQDGAGLRRVNLGDIARYNIIEIYRGSGSYHFTGGTREAAGTGGNPDAFVGVSRANLAVTFTQADGTTELLTLPAGGGGGGLTEAEVDARVVAGTLAEARAGDTGRWGEAKMFADTLVGVQVTGNALTLTDVRGGTAGRNLPNAVTGGALTLVGQQLSLQAYRHTGGAISLGSVSLPAGGGGGDDAYGWATVGNTDEMPRDKLLGTTLVGVTSGGGELVFENADGLFLPFAMGGGGNPDAFVGLSRTDQTVTFTQADGSTELLQLDNAVRGGSLNLAGSQLSVTLVRQEGVDLTLGPVTLPAGGGGTDAYDWATVGNSARIPLAKAPGNLLHTVANETYNLLRFTEADGTEHDITVNLPATGSVTEPMLAMHNTPANGQVISWNLSNARMEWVNAATDQRIVDLINDHNPTATPGAVTQTGGGDRGSGPRFGWEDHTHQIVGIQLDDIPGTPTTTVPDNARLLVELADGTNRKITGANARTSLGGGGGGIDINGLTVLSGNLDHDDDLVVYDDSTSANRKVPMTAFGAYTIINFAGLINTTVTPHDQDWFYFGDRSNDDEMSRVSGANLKAYIGGDSGQVEENTRVVEHILDRLADFDERVSDIDQTSVDDTLSFVTTVNMKTNASEPTDADRTTGSYSAALTSLTIGPNETGYVIFRIGIDESPNFYEPQLRDSGNDTIIQNLTSLGFATELSETAGHRYFYLPLHFPVEDTGTLRMRKTTRTAHHNWEGTVTGATRTVLVDETSNRTANYQLITSGGDSVPIPESGDIEITVEVLSGTDRNGSMAHTKIEAAHLRGLPVGKGAGAASGQSDANGRTFPMGANRFFAIARSTDAIPLLMGGPQNAGDLTGDFAIRVVHIT